MFNAPLLATLSEPLIVPPVQSITEKLALAGTVRLPELMNT